MAWRCGKCDGLDVPEHHWSCPLRTSPPPRGIEGCSSAVAGYHFGSDDETSSPETET